jgi:hypothetical protein
MRGKVAYDENIGDIEYSSPLTGVRHNGRFFLNAATRCCNYLVIAIRIAVIFPNLSALFSGKNRRIRAICEFCTDQPKPKQPAKK